MPENPLIIPNAAQAVFNNVVMGLGDLAYDTSIRALRVGDGVTPGGRIMPDNVGIGQIVATAIAGKLDKAGGTMAGILNMGGFRIEGISAPDSDDDATSKAYVDALIAAVNQAITGLSQGAGALPQTLDDRQVRAAAEWLDIDAKRLTGVADGLAWNAAHTTVANAIKSFVMSGPGVSPTDRYYIATFCNADPTYGDQIIIRSLSDQAQVVSLGTTPITKSTTGPTEVVLATSSITFTLLIDYRDVPTGLLINTAGKTALIAARGSGAVDRATRNPDEQLRGSLWLEPDAVNLVGIAAGRQWTADTRVLAHAIKHIQLHNADPTKQYLVLRLGNGHSAENDRIVIYNATDGVNVIDTQTTAIVAKAAAGITRVDIISGATGFGASLWIDYSELPAGKLYNPASAVSPLLIAKTASVQLLARMAQLGRARNIAFDGALVKGGTGASWNAAGIATNLVAANAALTARGVVTSIKIGTNGTFSGILYKNDVLPARPAGKWVLASCYVYSASGSAWPAGGFDIVPYNATSGGSVVAGKTIVASGYDQLNANVRRYWRVIRLPDDQTVARVAYGFSDGAVAGTAAEVGGFSVYMSEGELSRDNVATDDWSGYSTLDSWRDGVDTSLASLTSKGAPVRARNVAFDGAQTALGVGSRFQGGGTIPAPTATATADMLARGIVGTQNFGTGTTATGIYKNDTAPPRPNGKYGLASVYVYTATGANWPGAMQALSYSTATGGSQVPSTPQLATGYDQVTPNLRRYWVQFQFQATGTIGSVAYGFGTIVTGSAAELGGWTIAFADDPITIASVALDDWTGFTSRDSWRDGVDAQLVTLASKTPSVRSRNIAFDGILAAGGTGTSFQGTATRTIAAANAELTARGVVNSHAFGTGVTGALYKRDDAIPRPNGKFGFASCYVYSATGANWPGNLAIFPYSAASGGSIVTGTTTLAAGFDQVTTNLRRYWTQFQLPATGTIGAIVYGFNAAVSGSAAEIGGWTLALGADALNVGNVGLDDWTGYSSRDSWRDGVDTRLTTNEANITALQNAGSSSGSYPYYNTAINPALEVAGDTPVWGTNQSGGVTYTAPTSTDFTTRGIERAVKAGSDAPSGFIYKQEPVDAAFGSQYYFASYYVYSSDGATWPSSNSIFFYTASGQVSGTSVGMSFVQISTNVRLYYVSGTAPARADMTYIRYGFGTKATVPAEFGGFTFIRTSANALTRANTKADDWYGQYTQPKTIAANARALAALQAALAGVSTTSTQTASRALRVAMMGSSITWGNGRLGEDTYAGVVEDWLRNIAATTVLGSAMTTTGTSASVAGKNWYKNAVQRLSGVNASASFTLAGDELSLVIGRERGNLGAAIIDLYVDNVLYDSFSTFNEEPFVASMTANFTGDGTSKLFDLGKTWTFGHAVTVSGAAKAGTLYTGGYNGAIPAGDDYMVVRQYATAGDGSTEVRHFLMFDVAPANGAPIADTFGYGESVSYTRYSVGNQGQSFATTLEAATGIGSVAYDPANPSAISSGLGFRQSDPRAVMTWHFADTKSRAFRLVVRQLDTRATGTTPELWLNFATNRMHHFMNAGIGGWSAPLFVSDAKLNNYSYVLDFQPDIVFLESGTNEDNQSNSSSVPYHQNKAWVTRTGLTDAQVRNDDSANYFNAVTATSGTYTVQDIRIPITAITKRSATFDGTGATFNVAVGDALVIGDYKNDNRRVATRIVKTWDAGTRTATWEKPLDARELAHINALSDLVGGYAFFANDTAWTGAIDTIVAGFRAQNPQVEIALGSSGIPNFHDRSIEGYRELLREKARALGTDFMDFYGVTGRWTYTLPPNTQLYIDASNGLTSTGAASYTLYKAGGVKLADNTARPISVKVNGVERLNKGCYVIGGRTKGWPSSVSSMSKTDAAHYNGDFVVKDYQLVFSSDVPASGATFDIKFNPTDWSSDDTHPAAGAGFALFGRACLDPVLDMTRRALARATERLWFERRGGL